MESSPRSQPLPKAIKETLAYASFFDYDLTLSELHHWLISTRIISLSVIQQLTHLSDVLSRKRLSRQKISRHKLHQAHHLVNLLRLIPTIELIAVTGSLAMENAKRTDDIDLMIITKQGTLWLTRLLVVPFVRLFFKSRYPKSKSLTDSVCLNLWLDTTALSLPLKKRNLYTAHEVLQIKPIFNRHLTYERFILANRWTQKHLANAYKLTTLLFPPRERIPRAKGGGLGWGIINKLNIFAFRLQLLYMKSKMTSETVSLNSAYFHPRSLASALSHHLEKAHS